MVYQRIGRLGTNATYTEIAKDTRVGVMSCRMQAGLSSFVRYLVPSHNDEDTTDTKRRGGAKHPMEHERNGRVTSDGLMYPRSGSVNEHLQRCEDSVRGGRFGGGMMNSLTKEGMTTAIEATANITGEERGGSRRVVYNG